jgi:hypothetical protein
MMSDWSPWDIVVSSIGVASFALFLLDRAHRAAISQLKESCATEQSELQRQIDELKKRLGIRGTE